MTKKPTLFGASFEQFKKIVDKMILSEEGAQIGNASSKNAVIACYFFKYRKEYRQYFKITGAQWYDKWRAKLKKMLK